MKKKTMENELIQNGIVVIIYPMYVQDLHLKINVKNFLDIKIFKGDHNSALIQMYVHMMSTSKYETYISY